MGYCFTLKMNGLSSLVKRKARCMLLSERSQSQKAAHYMISIIWHPGKGEISRRNGDCRRLGAFIDMKMVNREAWVYLFLEVQPISFPRSANKFFLHIWNGGHVRRREKTPLLVQYRHLFKQAHLPLLFVRAATGLAVLTPHTESIARSAVYTVPSTQGVLFSLETLKGNIRLHVKNLWNFSVPCCPTSLYLWNRLEKPLHTGLLCSLVRQAHCSPLLSLPLSLRAAPAPAPGGAQEKRRGGGGGGSSADPQWEVLHNCSNQQRNRISKLKPRSPGVSRPHCFSL